VRIFSGLIWLWDFWRDPESFWDLICEISLVFVCFAGWSTGLFRGLAWDIFCSVVLCFVDLTWLGEHQMPKFGVTVKDVAAPVFIKAFAEQLKASEKVKLPEWVDQVKTAAFKQLTPFDRDWYYTRAGMFADLTLFFLLEGVIIFLAVAVARFVSNIVRCCCIRCREAQSCFRVSDLICVVIVAV
jgi:hypothetical protein